MGKANGIWYWATQTCKAPFTTGSGQTTSEVPTGCTNGVCNHSISAAMMPVMQPVQKELNVETGGFPLSACSLPQDTPAEIDEKLKAIIEESKQLQEYLLKLEQFPLELTVDHLKRIQCWRAYLCCLIAYLEDASPGADPPEKKIANYCTSAEGRKSVVETYREHEAAWSITFVDGARGRAFILDRQQKAPLVSAEQVLIEKGPGFIVIDKGVYEVTVGNLKADPPDDKKPDSLSKGELPAYISKTVYFRTFTFQKADDSRVYSNVGFQVLDPGTFTAKPAKITNRNTFGHLIQADPGSAFFLVSSVDDLSIAP
jgi:hypothetical protein